MFKSIHGNAVLAFSAFIFLSNAIAHAQQPKENGPGNSGGTIQEKCAQALERLIYKAQQAGAQGHGLMIDSAKVKHYISNKTAGILPGGGMSESDMYQIAVIGKEAKEHDASLSELKSLKRAAIAACSSQK